MRRRPTIHNNGVVEIHQSRISSVKANMSSERERELRRRRKRRKSVTKIKTRAGKASTSEKEVLAGKLRSITPGAEELIQRLKLES